MPSETSPEPPATKNGLVNPSTDGGSTAVKPTSPQSSSIQIENEDLKSEIKGLLKRMESLETRYDELGIPDAGRGKAAPVEQWIARPGPFLVETEITKIKSEDWRTKLESFKKAYRNQTTLLISMASNSTKLSYEPDSDKCEIDDLPKPSSIGDEFANRTPDRIAIADSALLTEFNDITNPNTVRSNQVILSPFKPFIIFESQLREALKKRTKEHEDLIDQRVSVPDATSSEKSAQEVKESSVETKPNSTDVDGTVKATEETDSNSLENRIRKAERLENGLKCIVHFLDIYLKPSKDLRAKVKTSSIQEIAFRELWHLYQPGDVVITTNKRQAYRVLHVCGGRVIREHEKTLDQEQKLVRSLPGSDFTLDCIYIDFDGREFGPVSKVITIAPYEDFRPITSFEVYPLSFAPDVESKLVKRGTKFVKLAGVTHKAYKGLSLKEPNIRHEELESDVIIDFALAYKNSHKVNIGYEGDMPDFDEGCIADPTFHHDKDIMEHINCPDCGCCVGDGAKSIDDTIFDTQRRTEFLDNTKLLEHVSLEKSMDKSSGKVKLHKEHLILLPIRVLGYVLLNRRWYPLDIDLVRDIKEKQKERDGFEDLVLPPKHKKIVRALVKVHAKPPESFSAEDGEGVASRPEMDLVKGKGKGLIILLHGVPGVGKTSTAECVAANTRRPLFPITCGDIGATNAEELETRLDSYFELARKWGCVLLLDEADVFLGERKKGDIMQNSLVSVFLRVLEYYSGILILTTNRVGEFDEAIKSRIHISLYYPPLDKDSTMAIWKMNLQRLKQTKSSGPLVLPIDFDKRAIKKFAKKHWKDSKESRWNGRQIKNAFQTAVALAEWDHNEAVRAKERSKDDLIVLETSHFETVAEQSRKFDEYLTEVRRMNDAAYARTKGFRHDGVDATGKMTDKAEVKRSARGRQNLTKQEPNEPREPISGEDSSDSSDESQDSEEEMAKAKQEVERKKVKELPKKKQGKDEKQAKKVKTDDGKKQGKSVAVNHKESNSDDSDSE